VRSGGWSVEAHEAYLVVSEQILIGVYLPVTGRVVLLDKPFDLRRG